MTTLREWEETRPRDRKGEPLEIGDLVRVGVHPAGPGTGEPPYQPRYFLARVDGRTSHLSLYARVETEDLDRWEDFLAEEGCEDLLDDPELGRTIIDEAGLTERVT